MPTDSAVQIDPQARVLPYVRPAELDLAQPRRVPVVVVGAGPTGLSVSIDLAQQGVPVVLLDDDDRLSTGSRALAFAKRTLEIFDRLGVGDSVVAAGVGWRRGKVFLRDVPVYAFDLQPEAGHKRPAFVNLQQSRVEDMLVDRACAVPGLEMRWKSRVVGIEPHDRQVTVAVYTPDGGYRLEADWVVAADGARSPVRNLMALQGRSRSFRDRFLIVDVRMKADFPNERWFWFDPPFHPHRSVLLHKQPDDVWRLEFQLGWDADPAVERQPERVMRRLRALLGEQAGFELLWVNVYAFACMRMDRFRHGRVLFAGDAAHGVAPFGARGANAGVQDADNLAWKLARVVQGRSPEALLDSYDAERALAADENIRDSSRAAEFITPASHASRVMRDAVLALARSAPFARALVNSGRPSVPAVLRGSPLSTPDDPADVFEGLAALGTSAPDAPVRLGAGGHDEASEAWLLDLLQRRFTLMVAHDPADADLPDRLGAAARDIEPEACVLVVLDVSDAAQPPRPSGGRAARPGLPGAQPLRPIVDPTGLLRTRYDLRAGTAYLFRPDQHVAARWRRPDAPGVAAALRRAAGLPEEAAS